MTVALSPLFNGWQGFSISGLPLAGGLLNTYLAGTSTPAATFTDNTGGTPNANPIQLDAAGLPPNEIWLTQGVAYKFVVTDSLGLNARTYDNISGVNDGSAITAALSASSGSSLVGFIQAGTGAVATTVQTKNRQIISVFDFMSSAQIANVIAGSLTLDVTAALQAGIAAVAAAGGGTLYLPAGSYLISSTLTVSTTGVTLLGTMGSAIWNGVATVLSAGSVIVKKSTMTTDAIKSIGVRFTFQNIAVLGQSGNTGDGIYLGDGQNSALINVSVAKMGGNGIRIGTRTGDPNGNVNAWQFSGVTSEVNGGHGVLIYDQSASGGPNANAGTATGLSVVGNTGDGLRIENGQFNTFVGLLAEENTGFGVTLVGTVSLSLYVTFTGGDVEGNTAGQWSIGANAKHIQMLVPATMEPAGIDPGTSFAAVISGGKALLRGVQFGSAQTTLSNYLQGTYTPTPTNLTVVNGTGGATYVGKYTQIGNIVTVWIEIVTTGTCTTASTLGSTNFTLPSIGAPTQSSTGGVVDEAAGNSLGVGWVRPATSLFYTPPWTARAGNIGMMLTYPIT